jgi:hypothetical protein
VKATFPDGTVFDGSPEEFLIIRNGGGGATNGHKHRPVVGAGLWTEKKAQAFWNNLDPRNSGGDQKKLLQFLRDKGGRANEAEVRKHLGITKGQQLAGVLANLSRNARREAKDDDVKAVIRTYDKGVRIYSIPDELLQFIKQF